MTTEPPATGEEDERESPDPIRRIIVLLDASQSSLRALDTAVELARRRRSELHALFVVETALLRSAGFAFASEIGAISGARRPLQSAPLEASLQRRAERVRRAVERAIAGEDIPHSISVRRGAVVTEVLELTGPDDLLVLGKVGWSAAPGRALGSTARELATNAFCPVLLLPLRPERQRNAVVVLVDDLAHSRNALRLAQLRAHENRRPLTIFLTPEADAERDRERSQAVSDWLRQAGGERSRIQPLCSLDPRALKYELRAAHASELVVSRATRPMRSAGANGVLERVDIPVIVTD